MKQSVIRVDAPTPCHTPEARDLFDAVIDLTLKPNSGADSTRRRNTIVAAKRVCHGCPVRGQCLDVHGRDFELGVVAGASDAERAVFFGEEASA